MTAPDVVELGRRAVACPGWRWVPGMRGHENATPGMSLHRGGMFRVSDESDVIPHAGTPDLTDGPTLGALLGLVREAWGDPYMVAMWLGEDWAVICERDDVSTPFAGRGASEAVALVAALEAAPVRS